LSLIKAEVTGELNRTIMAEETIDDNQESTPDEVADETVTEESSNDDVEAIKAENEKLKVERKQQQDRAVKAEKQLKAVKEKPQTENNSPISDEKYERLELQVKGYSDDEVESIMDLGGMKTLDNPLMKEAIALQRRKAKSESATPSGTAKSPVYQKFSERDLKNMPLAELEKIIPQE